MIVTIKRQDNKESEPYFQSFNCETSPDMTVIAVLDKLNSDPELCDIEGKAAGPIYYESGCRQKICGACAMVINGIPKLACSAFVRDIKKDRLTIEPLSKFPVIRDLVVDRSIIDDNLKKADVYIADHKNFDNKDFSLLYSASKCIKCGICLEVCPNYVKGENFFGALFANDACLVALQSNNSKKIKAEYNKHFARGCSKSGACVDVCPMHIDTLASVCKMNRT